MSGSKRRSNSKLDITEQQQAAVLEAFSLFDQDKKGEIKAADLKLVMRALGFEPRRDEIKKATSELDKNGTGTITYDKFLIYMAGKIAEKDTREEILKAFRLFDDDQTGKISFQNLKRVAAELGENISEEELREMLTEADQDGDGEVNQEEFFRIMKKTCLY